MAGVSGLVLTGRAASPVRRRRVLADLHLHIGLNDWLATTPTAIQSPVLADVARLEFNRTRATWEGLHAAGVDLVCVAHFNPFDEWLSMPTDPSPEAPRNTLRMIDRLEAELAGPAARYATLVRNHDELIAALEIPPGDERFRVAAVHTLEGGHALGGDLGALDRFAERGVAVITITHFFNKGIASAPNAFPFFPDANVLPPKQGLSEFGRDVVRRMEELGITVDVTHCTTTALAEVLALSSRPLLATHASARTMGDHGYSLVDEHIQEIARRGGVIGVILYPHVLSNYGEGESSHDLGSLRDIVRTVRYVCKLCGTHRAVGIGSDFSGFIDGPREMRDLSRIDRLRDALLDEFGDASVVEDILARNVIDFLERNWVGPGGAR